MRKIRLFIAMSLDGYIADSRGSVDWLEGQGSDDEKIRFVNINPVDLVKGLREENGKDIWICGGANLIRQLVNENLIDYYYITVIPTLLGSGIRLFENAEREIKLRLLKTQSYNGMTDLIYIRRMVFKERDRFMTSGQILSDMNPVFLQKRSKGIRH